MNIASVSNTYNQGQVNCQAKLPSGAAARETVNAFERVISRIGNPMNSTDVSKTMNGISEGISSVEEELKADAQAARANLKALFNKLSGAEAVELDENGFDINDIEDEELVTVVDRIKIMLAAYNENYQAFAGSFDIPDGAALEDGSGNLAARVAAKLNDGYMPATDENITDVVSTMEMADDIAGRMPLTDEAKAFLIGNRMEPNIENLYKANHSTINNGYRTGLTNDQWIQIKSQVSKVIKESGLDDNEKVYEDAKWLIANELPVTGDNLKFKDWLDNLEYEYDENEVITEAVDSMAGGKRASQIMPADNYNVWKEAAGAIHIINQASYEIVADIVGGNRKLTINEMAEALNKGKDGSEGTDADTEGQKAVVNSSQYISSYRVLCEARILMTASSAVSIINKGIDIYSEDLQDLVELLQEEETKFINEQLTKADADSISEADLLQVSNINETLMGLKFMPCAAIGGLISYRSTLTITSVHSAAFSMQRQYEQAGQSYETMSTKVRSDMGDSIKDALNNSGGSILSELGYEVNGTNLRAVRILAYNNMEMTPENINEVKNLDSILNNLMDNMTPQITYQMIQDGINPMDADIEILNQYINENYNLQDETVKYSEFLYKLEKTEGISEEERKQYIGIYKMFHMFRKDEGKAVGALINQNAEINLKNLVMAVNSRKKYNMDVTLAEDAGLAEVTGSVSYYQNLFTTMSKTITPAALKKASKEDGSLEEMSPEKMAEILEQYKESDKEVKEEYYSEMIEEAREYQNLEDNIIRLLTDNSIPVTFYNIMAAKELMGGNAFYRDLQKIENSRLGEALEGLFESVEDKDSLDHAYDELNKSIKYAGEQIMEDSREDTYLDIRTLKNLGKTVNLMSSLSRHQQYFIPFETEEGMGSIHLKIIRTSENAGKMEMKFETESLGKVYAEFYVGSEKTSGYIVSDKKDAAEMLAQSVDNIYAGLEDLGITDADIRTGHSDHVPAVNLPDEGKGAPSALIYKTAKEILANLIQIRAN